MRAPKSKVRREVHESPKSKKKHESPDPKSEERSVKATQFREISMRAPQSDKRSMRAPPPLYEERSVEGLQDCLCDSVQW